MAEAVGILDEALAPEPRFYKNQPVLVSQDGGVFKKRLLDHIDKSPSYNYVCTDSTCWLYCKPDPDAESIINWVEWGGGKRPVSLDQFVATEDRNGFVQASRNKAWRWSHIGSDKDIVRYAIIPLPEFL